MKAMDVFRALGDLDTEAEVYLISTQPGFRPTRGMLVAQCDEGSDALILTDYDMSNDAGLFDGLGIPVEFKG